MRLVSFFHQRRQRLGVQIIRDHEVWILDLNRADPRLPAEMLAFLGCGERGMDWARQALLACNKAALIPEREVLYLAPVPRPGKVLCLGHNYYGHVGLGSNEAPQYPNIFCKTVNTITGPGHHIILPPATQQADYEAELMVVLGKRAWRITEDEAQACIAGYTIFNDVSARDYQKRTNQWMLSKSFDTFGPMGPALVTPDEVPDPYNLELELTVNGVMCQRANTRDLIFSAPHLIAYLSAVMTLEPGDVIATGTPAKLPEAAEAKRFLQHGDIVKITIEHLGTLVNPVFRKVE